MHELVNRNFSRILPSMLVNTSALLGMRVDEAFVSDKLESVSDKLFFWLLLFQTVFHASYDSTVSSLELPFRRRFSGNFPVSKKMHSGTSKVFAHFTSRSDNMINNRVRKIPIFGTRSSCAFALYTSYVAWNAFLFEWDNLECCVLVAVRGDKPYLFLEKLRFGLRDSHCIMINGIVWGAGLLLNDLYLWQLCILTSVP